MPNISAPVQQVPTTQPPVLPSIANVGNNNNSSNMSTVADNMTSGTSRSNQQHVPISNAVNSTSTVAADTSSVVAAKKGKVTRDF